MYVEVHDPQHGYTLLEANFECTDYGLGSTFVVVDAEGLQEMLWVTHDNWSAETRTMLRDVVKKLYAEDCEASLLALP